MDRTAILLRLDSELLSILREYSQITGMPINDLVNLTLTEHIYGKSILKQEKTVYDPTLITSTNRVNLMLNSVIYDELSKEAASFNLPLASYIKYLIITTRKDIEIP